MDFIEGEATKALVDNTVALSTLTDLTSFDAVFFAGGFGTMWDFPAIQTSSASPRPCGRAAK